MSGTSNVVDITNRILAGILLPALLRVTPVEVTDEDRYWLARAVAGEVGVMGFHREFTGIWVVHVALNRAAAPWYPNSVSEVVQQRGAFNGAYEIIPPPDWAYQIVREALRLRDKKGDVTRGSFFVLGGLDLTEGNVDWSSCRGVLTNGDFSVAIFSRWPREN